MPLSQKFCLMPGEAHTNRTTLATPLLVKSELEHGLSREYAHIYIVTKSVSKGLSLAVDWTGMPS